MMEPELPDMNDLHAAIMNIPDGIQPNAPDDEFMRGFRFGHRAARHAAAELALAAGTADTPTPEPVYWQWRRTDEPWTVGKYTFNSEPSITAPNTEKRALYAGPVIAFCVQVSFKVEDIGSGWKKQTTVIDGVKEVGHG